MFEEIEKNKKKGEQLLFAVNAAVSAIAVHPKDPIIAIAGAPGYLRFFDYVKKEFGKYNEKHFNKDHPSVKGYSERKEGQPPSKDEREIFTCVEFTVDGLECLVAKTGGNIEIIDVKSGEWKSPKVPLVVSDSNSDGKRSDLVIKQLIVSPDG